MITLRIGAGVMMWNYRTCSWEYAPYGFTTQAQDQDDDGTPGYIFYFKDEQYWIAA